MAFVPSLVGHGAAPPKQAALGVAHGLPGRVAAGAALPRSAEASARTCSGMKQLAVSLTPCAIMVAASHRRKGAAARGPGKVAVRAEITFRPVKKKDEDDDGESALAVPQRKAKRVQLPPPMYKVRPLKVRSESITGKRTKPYMPPPIVQVDLGAMTMRSRADVEPLVLLPVLGAARYQRWFPNWAGDGGFDPMGLAPNRRMFEWQRQAELKHARLAMLGAIGWPASEAFHGKIAKAMGMQNWLSAGGTAPSLLNGTSHAEIIFFCGIPAIGFMIFDYVAEEQSGPGRFGWDPLNLEFQTIEPFSGLVPEGRIFMEEAEMLNGRLAMLAITAMVAAEAYTSVPITRLTPWFFRPIWDFFDLDLPFDLPTF